MRALRASPLALLLLLAGAGTVSAQELRVLNPIPTPAPQAAPPVPFRPIPRVAIERGVQAIFDAWNTPRLRGLLSTSFYDTTKLPDELASKLPRDATLRLLSLESMTTLRQWSEAGPNPSTVRLVSVVAVVVRSQIEYNDPTLGFQRIEGTQELLLDVKQVLPR